MTSARSAAAALRAAAAFCFVLVGASCAGGGGDGIVGSGGTGAAVPTVSVGAITGFGSVVVNGIRYDDAAASVTRDDNRALANSELRLGMFVEVRGTADAAAGTGIAESIVARSELIGAVQGRTASGFSLLGVRVHTNANTVYDNTADVADGDLVEVYGAFDPGNASMLATRIEKKSPVEYKLRGLVSGLDSSAGRFSIGTVPIDYANVGPLPGLQNGLELKVVGPAPTPGVAWRIDRASIQSGLSVARVARVDVVAAIEQYVSRSNFRVTGLAVDATNAVIEAGLATDLAAGVTVEVEGELQAGVVQASWIRIKDKGNSGPGSSGSGTSGAGGGGTGGTGTGTGSSGTGSSGTGSSGTGSSGTGSSGTGSSGSGSSGSGSSGSGSSGSGSSGSGSDEFDVKGFISDFASAASFVVRGMRTDASGNVRFDNGSAALLQNGVCVNIRGTLVQTAAGSTLSASRVKFDGGC